MNKILFIFLFTLLISIGAKSQFSWGARVLIPFNIESFDFRNISLESVSIETKQYFYAGITAEAILPVVGLGVEGSALITMNSISVEEIDKNFRQGYLNIPINLKYRLCMPGLEKFISAHITIGPYFNIKIIGNNIRFGEIDSELKKIVFEPKPYNWGMNYGFGFNFFKTLQIGVNYIHSVNHPFIFDEILIQNSGLNQDIGKYKGWLVSVSLMF